MQLVPYNTTIRAKRPDRRSNWSKCGKNGRGICRNSRRRAAADWGRSVTPQKAPIAIRRVWGVHLTGVSDLPPRVARCRAKLGGCPRCLDGFRGTQAAILPDAHRTGRRSRKAIAAIRGSLHQSETKPETPHGTQGSGCWRGDGPLPRSTLNSG